MNSHTILFYATTWCYDCRMARNILDKNKIPYQYINIDEDPAAAQYVMSVNRGYRSVPTIVFSDGTFLVEPGRDELLQKLEELEYLAA